MIVCLIVYSSEAKYQWQISVDRKLTRRREDEMNSLIRMAPDRTATNSSRNADEHRINTVQRANRVAKNERQRAIACVFLCRRRLLLDPAKNADAESSYDSYHQQFEKIFSYSPSAL